MNREALPLLTALLAASAGAQELSSSLPLTSVGSKLMWTVGDQDLRLVVGMDARVRLELYSPQLDPDDYRSPDEYGDEHYDAQPVTTTFTLLGDAGQVLRQQTFGAGSHDWQAFLDQDLPGGTYTLKVRTEGNAKNTFAVRVNSVSASVEADRVNVNVHARDWTPAVNVHNDGGPLSLRLYDGDGATELEAELRDDAGHTYPVKVSGQLDWETIQVPETPGNYTVYLRQPVTARQYSNTVGFSLFRSSDAQVPLTIARADTTGRLTLTAELVLPNGTQSTTAPVQVGDRTLTVNGTQTLTVPAQAYALHAAPVAGAAVTLSAPSVTVRKGETAQAKVQVRPNVQLTLKADKDLVCVGDVVTFTATARTAFAGDLPAELRASLPMNLQPVGAVEKTATLNAQRPTELRFEARAVLAGAAQVRADLGPWGQSQTTDLRVLASTTQLELRRADLPSALPGETVNVSFTVTNASGAPADFTVEDQPGANLQAQASTTFSGTLQPGETRELRYPALVVGQSGDTTTAQATLRSACEGVQTSSAAFTVATPAEAPTPAPQAAPAITRESTVRIPFDAPKVATQLVIAHALPAGSTYVPGSSTLEGHALPDPVIGTSGRAYWTVPGSLRGLLTYRVTHTGALPTLSSPALIGKYAFGRREVLVGDANLADLDAATPAAQAAPQENDGDLKLPLAGTVYRTRDKISISVVGTQNDPRVLTVNGAPVTEASLGGKTLDPTTGQVRLDYVGVNLRPGENVLAYGDQTIKVYLASAAVNVEFTPVNLEADGVTPLRLKVRVVDANGLTPDLPALTLDSTLEPTAQDAAPKIGSYQVRLTDGEGTLELPALTAPTRFTVRALLGAKVIERNFEATPGGGNVAVGFVSATAGLGGNPTLSARGQAYAEQRLGSGKLYVAVTGGYDATLNDGQLTGAPTDEHLPTTANPTVRYPAYGDASTEQLALQGMDPVAFRYEHPTFNVQYRQAPVPIDVFSIGETPTALSGFTRTNPQVSGFAAWLPRDLGDDTLIPDGTRVLRLSHTGAVPDSETVQLVTRDRVTGAVTTTTLTRYADYTLDPDAGVLYLSKAITAVDEHLNDVRLHVTYRVLNRSENRTLGYGAQVKGTFGAFTAAAAVVRMDGVTSTGARLTYDTQATHASVTGAYADGVMLAADARTTYAAGDATLSAHYQDASYDGLNKGTAGFGVNASANYAFTPALTGTVTGQYTRTLNADDTTTEGGTVTALARYRTGALAVGGGLKAGTGTEAGVSAVASASYDANPFSVSVQHAQPISAGTQQPTTDITTKVQVAPNVTLGVTDTITWGEGQRASVSLNSKLGGTNLSAAYDLPTASGEGNRARFGADTSLALTDHLTLGLNGSVTLAVQNGASTYNAGASLRYTQDRLTATAKTDFSVTQGRLKTVLAGGVTYSLSDQWTLTTDGTTVLGSDPGTRFTVGTTLRDGPWQGLAYARYQTGSLAGGTPQLTGEASLEYHRATYAVRGNLAARTNLNDPDSFTYQPSASATWYVTDRLGLGLNARALLQPAAGFAQYGYGAEASLRVLSGTWLTVGYNLKGFDGVGSSVYTRPGAYLRLDLLLDEGQRK
ncbi:DUF11 domain-containing protein [Deinococcus maricopensis]|uniref:Conserved repeat domain protein n=1 Tax=Deinococcus maricopensis (strain DSM 21211 / LMG 22137 / NRRL B-23946 / LB-34) TaxID=709986 RepID=E8U6B9_DEIML|nr:DUF11 domain-containing protein [Deinococcus maricopensis]ADV66608.1 conserved repeat domain protein [Deinococcus maricopensis DSM 21211]